MIVYLDELCAYITSSSTAFLNTKTGEYVYESPEFEFVSHPDYVQIPKDNNEYVLGFIDTISDKTVRRKLLSSLDNNSYSQIFHKLVVDIGLYDIWLDYLHRCEIEFARKWCTEVGINYSKNQVQQT